MTMTNRMRRELHNRQLKNLHTYGEFSRAAGAEFVVIGAAARNLAIGSSNALARPIIDIGLTVKSFAALIEQWEQQPVPNFLFHTALNSKDHSLFEASWISTNSLYYVPSSPDLDGAHGTRLRLNIFRPGEIKARGFKGKLATYIELGHDASLSDLKVSEVNRSHESFNKIVGNYKRLANLVGEQRLITAAIKIESQLEEGSQSELFFRRRKKGGLKRTAMDTLFPAKVLKRSSTSVPIPPGKAYFNETYGRRWKSRKYSDWEPGKGVLIAAEMPFKELDQRVRSRGTSLDQARVNRQNYITQRDAVESDINKVRRYWDLLARTSDRYRMWELYNPKREVIIDLAARGQYALVKTELTEFRKTMEQYSGRGLGFCFDPELFEIQMRLYEVDGMEDYANKLRKLVPQEHWAPIVITTHDRKPERL